MVELTDDLIVWDEVESGVYCPKMAQPIMVFQALGLFPFPGLDSGSIKCHTLTGGQLFQAYQRWDLPVAEV